LADILEAADLIEVLAGRERSSFDRDPAIKPAAITQPRVTSDGAQRQHRASAKSIRAKSLPIARFFTGSDQAMVWASERALSTGPSGADAAASQPARIADPSSCAFDPPAAFGDGSATGVVSATAGGEPQPLVAAFDVADGATEVAGG